VKNPRRAICIDIIEKIVYKEIRVDKEVFELAERYVKEGIISQKYRDDAIHIAAATVSGCDMLVSWNFRHIVRAKTIFGVNGVNKLMGYKEIQIVSPNMIVEEE